MAVLFWFGLPASAAAGLCSPPRGLRGEGDDDGSVRGASGEVAGRAWLPAVRPSPGGLRSAASRRWAISARLWSSPVAASLVALAVEGGGAAGGAACAGLRGSSRGSVRGS